MEKTYGVCAEYDHAPTTDEIVNDLGDQLKELTEQLVLGHVMVQHFEENPACPERWTAAIKFRI